MKANIKQIKEDRKNRKVSVYASDIVYDLIDQMCKINLNTKVRVQLTEHGKIILEMDEYASKKPDADGFLEMQLWKLMRVFGPVMFLGNPNMPFTNMNVELLR